MPTDAGSKPYTLMTPGPVPVPPEILDILSQPIEHHRTPEFTIVLKRVLERLKQVFATRENVFLHTSTGSGGMESALINVLSPGDDVLAIVSGKFGERWANMAEAYGANVQRLNVEWGHAVRPEQVESALRARPSLRIVLTQACETSTGVLHPIREIAAVTRKSEALLLVDGITALGALPMPMDDWGIDALVGGSQKAFMLPTGLSFVAFSKRAWKRIETAKCPRYYFDIRTERDANLNGETLFSSNVPLIKALDVVLTRFESEGMDKIHARIASLAAATQAAAKELGLCSFALSPSPTLSALALPLGVDGQKLRDEMERTHRVIVMGGQDKLKGKIIRIGHMGYIRDQDCMAAIEALGRSLITLQPSSVSEPTLTAALAAASDGLVRRT